MGADDHSHIPGGDTVRRAVLGPPVHVDYNFPRPELEFFGDLPADELQGLPPLRAEFVLFRKVEHDLYPLQVLGHGQPTRMAPLGGRGLSPRWHSGGRVKRCLRLPLKHFPHEAIEYEPIGIDLLRAAGIDTPEELLHLMLESFHLPQGRGQLFAELFDLSLLLYDEIMCLCK